MDDDASTSSGATRSRGSREPPSNGGDDTGRPGILETYDGLIERSTVVTCCQCEGIERQFGSKIAQWELRRFRRRGPIGTTRMLIEALRRDGVAGASILDVGGGIGAIHHELLAAGAAEATHVHVSPDYLDVAREEVQRRGHAERVQFVRGDFVELAPELPAADIVTLDRVICCYPDVESLVARSAGKARRVYGAVYPREVWWMRLSVGAVNVINRLRRTAFRVYLHPPATIDAILRLHGLAPRSAQRTLAWEIVLYTRSHGRIVEAPGASGVAESSAALSQLLDASGGA